MRKIIRKLIALFMKIEKILVAKCKTDKLRHEVVKSAENRLTELRRLPNVDIDIDVILGINSDIQVYGIPRELRVEKYVNTRRSCNFLLYPGSALIIHENVFFNNFCSISCLGRIEIGENTMFGEGVKLYDHNHEYRYDNEILRISHDNFAIDKITIGRNCWIGSNVTILKGVNIGDNVIIGANCLIYQSISSNSIVKHKEDLIIETRE